MLYFTIFENNSKKNLKLIGDFYNERFSRFACYCLSLATESSLNHASRYLLQISLTFCKFSHTVGPCFNILRWKHSFWSECQDVQSIVVQNLISNNPEYVYSFALVLSIIPFVIRWNFAIWKCFCKAASPPPATNIKKGIKVVSFGFEICFAAVSAVK